MAQFGGQKNPPWATQFAATAVSQPGHSGQSLDLNSLHCKCIKPNVWALSVPLLPGAQIHSQICYCCALTLNSVNLKCHHIIFSILFYTNVPHFSNFHLTGDLFFLSAALGVQQPSLLGASPSVYSQQSALAAASLSNQSAANYQLSQQTAALQQQAAAAAAAALQQVSHSKVVQSAVSSLCILSWPHVTLFDQLQCISCFFYHL